MNRGGPGPAGSFSIFFDGACLDNPGPAGAGYEVYYDHIDGSQDLLLMKSKPLGERTSNQAEYLALIDVLQCILDDLNKRLGMMVPCSNIFIYGDSELVINQMLKRWKVRSDNVKSLNDRANNLANILGESYGIVLFFSWIPREENHRADTLAKAGAAPKIEGNPYNDYDNYYKQNGGGGPPRHGHNDGRQPNEGRPQHEGRYSRSNRSGGRGGNAGDYNRRLQGDDYRKSQSDDYRKSQQGEEYRRSQGDDYRRQDFKEDAYDNGHGSYRGRHRSSNGSSSYRNKNRNRPY